MSTEPPAGPGLGDLERELTCSICTDLLYQPLTLLDCLHTFCGSCLKEWFATQAARRSSSVRITCPSCRATVRETRPNATVTTLLDMVLAANPDRAKTAEEKVEIERRYKHGESILPLLTSPGGSAAESDEDDRRLLEEIRELSLQETRARTRTAHRSGQSSRTRRADNTDSDGQREDARSRRRREEERAARRQRAAPRPTPTVRSDEASERTRRVEHQSSLRSLLSLSDTETMEEEILRQIFEEGLLDDIDLDNLVPGQEEELSERIADAYRRRHRLRSRSQQRQETQETQEAPQAQNRPRARSQSGQRPQTSPTQSDTSRNPPAARPSLLEPPSSRPGTTNHQRRLSEQGNNRRRRTSPIPISPASSSDVTLRTTGRSSSDMIADRPRNSHARSQTIDATAVRTRRATSSDQSAPNVSVRGARERTVGHARTRSSVDSPRVSPSSASSPQESLPSPRLEISRPGPPAASSLVGEVGGSARQDANRRLLSSRSNASTQPVPSYPEPSISCDRCGKTNIQYDLHKTCPQCKEGDYHLCLRCYRLGRGCLDWKGFGPSAEADFERMRASANGRPNVPQQSQHVLKSYKYSRPPEMAQKFVRDGKEMTSDNPAHRLQQGLFCDTCQSPANDCFWKCNRCNEGDWGFCNRCVNQGKCCTHALLPICRIGSGSRPTGDGSNRGPNEQESFKILSFSTKCDICTCPIPTLSLRFHCLQCNDGDYDICWNCYLRLGAMAKISKEDRHNGWRRCLKGHRMVVIGFEDHEEGQRRVIVHDLVGGRALKENHLPPTSVATPTSASPATSPTTPATSSPEKGIGDWSWKEGTERRKKASRLRPAWTTERDRERITNPDVNTTPPSRRFPPDGGVGLIVHARWSWYPEDGVRDELMFPRGAEITEAENINDDWYWGCYAGMTGLFPGSHVIIVGEVA